MSLVLGPLRIVPAEVATYNDQERELLHGRPGITDIASIVFSDEGAILEGSADPDFQYRQLIRPWKSRLGRLYLRHSSVPLDFALILLTILAVISRPTALKLLSGLVSRLTGTRRIS